MQYVVLLLYFAIAGWFVHVKMQVVSVRLAAAANSLCKQAMVVGWPGQLADGMTLYYTWATAAMAPGLQPGHPSLGTWCDFCI